MAVWLSGISDICVRSVKAWNLTKIEEPARSNVRPIFF